MKWVERLEIIKQKIKEKLASEGVRDTDENVADFLNTSKPTYSKLKNNRQMPDVETMVTMATKLNLSADWLLLGVGEPDVTVKKAPSTCDVHIADTLGELVVELNRPLEEIALAGGLYPRELNLIIHRGKALPSESVQRWVHAYRVNANFLLAQVGQPFLTEEEYNAPGRLNWVREQHGDFIEQDDERRVDWALSFSERDRLQRELADARRTIAVQEEALALYREKCAQQPIESENIKKDILPKVVGEQK